MTIQPQYRFLKNLAIITFLLSFIGFASSQEKSEEQEEAPIVVVDNAPYLIVTIEDEVSEYDAWQAPDRQRILKAAFKKALTRSKLVYAYSVSFREQATPQWVPQLKLKIVDWRKSETEAFVCNVDGSFFDAYGKRHDLKGAFGTEMTLNMTSNKSDIEEYMESAAAKAMTTVIKRIYKKNLYREP